MFRGPSLGRVGDWVSIPSRGWEMLPPARGHRHVADHTCITTARHRNGLAILQFLLRWHARSEVPYSARMGLACVLVGLPAVDDVQVERRTRIRSLLETWGSARQRAVRARFMCRCVCVDSR